MSLEAQKARAGQPDSLSDFAAQRTLAVNWLRRRKKGRDTIAGIPSRFIAEMALEKTTIKEDPREKLILGANSAVP